MSAPEDIVWKIRIDGRLLRAALRRAADSKPTKDPDPDRKPYDEPH